MLSHRLLGVFKQYGPDVCWVVGEIVNKARGGVTYPLTGLPGPRADGYRISDALRVGRWPIGTLDLRVNTKYDRLIPWLANRANRAIKRRPNGLPVSVWEERVAEELSNIADWIRATGFDLLGNRNNIVDAISGSWEWHDELAAKKREDVEIIPGVEMVSWPDGWSVQELVTQEMRDAEGAYMGHCVAEYEENIYSLRDADDKPHVTIELESISFKNEDGFMDTGWVIAQVRGRKNNLIKRWSLCERLVYWFELWSIPPESWSQDFMDCFDQWYGKMR
jgi:hypothetical protein